MHRNNIADRFGPRPSNFLSYGKWFSLKSTISDISRYCVCYFLNIVSNPNRHFPSKNQFRDNHAWNRIEKLLPKHYANFRKLSKLCEKLPTCFQTLTFCRNLSFQKPWICQRIFHGFPTPWIFGEAAGAADKKRKNPNPILVFVGRSRGLPENPKSMGSPWGSHGVPWVPIWLQINF